MNLLSGCITTIHPDKTTVHKVTCSLSLYTGTKLDIPVITVISSKNPP